LNGPTIGWSSHAARARLAKATRFCSRLSRGVMLRRVEVVASSLLTRHRARMQEASFVIGHRVAAASLEVHSHAAASTEASRARAIRRGLPFSFAISIASRSAGLTHRVRTNSGVRSSHEPASPHNKRLESARVARPTRKSDALLLAAQPRRYVANS